MDDLDAIKANAELVIKTFPAADLDYDEKSVAWIDAYIERNRADWNDETRERLSSVLGSFLGECIRRNFGGAWKMTDAGLGVEFSGGNAAYPFHKIRKQFASGAENAIHSFYTTIPLIFQNSDSKE